MGRFGEFCGYAGWWIRARFDSDRPMVTTIVTHLGCNLRCRHCNLMNDLESGKVPPMSISFKDACRDLELRYRQGARLAYFEGGEPTMWHDGDRDLADLIRFAKDVGYLGTGYTTNGTGRMFTESSVISVSLDGPREVHDSIRQEGVFESLMENLRGLSGYRGSVFANMVIQKSNADYLEETAEIALCNPNIDGIIFNFLTPPPGSQTLTHAEKERAVAELRGLKEEGFPILNTDRGLKLLLEEDWSGKCPCGMTVFTLPDGTHITGCPMKDPEGSCRECGFAAVREYSLVRRGNPSAIMELAPTFALSRKNRRGSDQV